MTVRRSVADFGSKEYSIDGEAGFNSWARLRCQAMINLAVFGAQGAVFKGFCVVPTALSVEF